MKAKHKRKLEIYISSIFRKYYKCPRFSNQDELITEFEKINIKKIKLYAKTLGNCEVMEFDYVDIESINYMLFYVSDRWRCCHRLKWFINLIEYYQRIDCNLQKTI